MGPIWTHYKTGDYLNFFGGCERQVKEIRPYNWSKRNERRESVDDLIFVESVKSYTHSVNRLVYEASNKNGEIHSIYETTLSELVTMILPQAVSRQIIIIKYKSFMLTRLLQTLSFIRNIVFCELSPSELLLKPYIVNDDWTEAKI